MPTNGLHWASAPPSQEEEIHGHSVAHFGPDHSHRDGLTTICVWSPDGEETPVFRRRLHFALNDTSRTVRRVVRVRQEVPRRVRFDVHVLREAASTVRHLLFTIGSNRWGWYNRYHIPHPERFALGMVRRPRLERRRIRRHVITDADLRRPFRVGTLNANGVRSKRDDISLLLQETDLDCLAIQETLVAPEDWRFWIPGFQCFHVLGGRQASQRGVCILLREKYSGYVIGRSSPWHICVRVSGGGLADPVLVMCVYVPHGPDRWPMRQLVSGQISQVTERYHGEASIVLGDLNAGEEVARRWIRNWGVGWNLLPSTSEPEVQADRVIDHIVVKDPRTSGTLESRILTSYDISDHPPVILEVPAEAWNRRPLEDGWQRVEARGERPCRKRIVLKPQFDARAIVSSNSWQAFATEGEYGDEEESVQAKGDRLAEDFVRVSHELADSGKLRVQRNANLGPRVPRRIQRAIADRRRLYVNCRQAAGPEDAARARAQYEVAKAKARRETILVRRRRWRKSILQATLDFRRCPKKFWSWASNVAGWRLRKRSQGIQPVRDPHTGELAMEAGAIVEAWRMHYERLCRDETGNSRDGEAHWRGQFPGPDCAPMDILNTNVEWGEVACTLGYMKRHKAPGEDGIPVEFLSLCQNDGDSNMAKALMKVLRLMWDNAIIPEEWKTSVVVSIPKKGDPSEMDNYRGISLMPTVVKILATLLARRLSSAFEDSGWFSRGQAGFRNLEECVIQAATLVEVCQRRRIAGVPTFLAFIDLRKAFDTVPHGALFRKLERGGVGGKALAFIKALYDRSFVKVRVGSGRGARLTEAIPVRRGVRQGCPLSPILFNIFINDALDEMEDLGIRIPTGLQSSHQWMDQRLAGLLFADDIVGTVPSAQNLQTWLWRMGAWARINEMEVGIRKCGLMVIGGEGNEVLRGRGRLYTINREPVPVVDEYEYLGLKFTPDLERSSLVEARLRKGQATVQTLKPFLGCTMIPLFARASVFKAVVVPRLLYGAEVYGKAKDITSRVQVMMNCALRALAGFGPSRTVANVALWREFHCPPVCASAAARKARAYQKCAQLRTWVRTLVQEPFRSRRWTWASGAVRWLNRYVKTLRSPATSDGPGPLVTPTWRNLAPDALSKAIIQGVWAREEVAAASQGGDWYVQADFSKRPVVSCKVSSAPELSSGLMRIVQLRLNGIWWVKRLARHGLVESCYEFECPWCGADVPETLEHFLFQCPQWDSERAKYLGELGIECATVVARETPNFGASWAVLLLGGQVNGKRIQEWRFREEYRRLRPEEYEPAGGDSDDSEDNDEDRAVEGFVNRVGRPGCLCMAAFLSETLGRRASLVRELRDSHSAARRRTGEPLVTAAGQRHDRQGSPGTGQTIV